MNRPTKKEQEKELLMRLTKRELVQKVLRCMDECIERLQQYNELEDLFKHAVAENELAKVRIAKLEEELSQSNFYYDKYQEYEELFKESVVKHELAKARIAELEAERDGLRELIYQLSFDVQTLLFGKSTNVEHCEMAEENMNRARKAIGSWRPDYNARNEPNDVCKRWQPRNGGEGEG